ncbi:MAG TPA: hypothetical protein VMD59_20635 [Acidimicrobiales bacterium]|nr:hypothetical protein [Acidimicrobiales bacterium]
MMRRRLLGHVTAVAAIGVLALLSSGCGGRSSPGVASIGTSTVPGSADSSAAPGSQALLVAGRCLRQHGLSGLPDPVIGTTGQAEGQAILDKQILRSYPTAVVQQALQACHRDLEQAGIGAIARAPERPSAQQIQKLLALARCIRAHGLPSFPDPNPITGSFGNPSGITYPQLLRAAEACRSDVKAAGLGMPTPDNSVASRSGRAGS